MYFYMWILYILFIYIYIIFFKSGVCVLEQNVWVASKFNKIMTIYFYENEY